MIRKRTAFYVVAAIILVFGLFLLIPNAVVGPQTDVSQVDVISYEGVSGRTALELLNENYDVEVQSFDFGDMVVSINGQSADATSFWAFYVDGEMAQVGAGDFETQDGQIIQWRLENIEFN